MKSHRAFALGALLVLAYAGAAHAALKPWLCPPKSFDSVTQFNAAKFFSAPWYVQKQIVQKAQPANQLFCSRIKFTAVDAKNLTKGFSVCNYANSGGVNKAAVGNCGAKATPIQALPWPTRRSDPTTAASKFLVGPTASIAGKSANDLAKPPMPGQPRLAAPFWVAAVGASKNPNLGYDWAILTGGNPSQATVNDACLPAAKTDDGFWLVTRTPIAPKATVNAMLAAARELRLDTAALVSVTQNGCTYAGAA